MLDRACAGAIPPKPHVVFKGQDGAMLYEECITRAGFDGPFSILYHRHRPHEAQPEGVAIGGKAAGGAVDERVGHGAAANGPVGFATPVALPVAGLARRHYRALEVPAGRSALEGRWPLLFNADVVLGVARPSQPDPSYFVNADADDLFFVLRGGGVLRSVFGDLRFHAGDYVGVPKGTIHRFVPDAAVEQAWLSIECKGGFAIPARYRNASGQLRMDAPYTHRDFRRPAFVGPLDEGLRSVTVKRGDAFWGFESPHPPLDVVGWDGAVYPFAFSILAFQPRVGQIHLPPTVHTTFEARGAIICSFVPRLLDFHPQANPCPYPHASVDVDEVLFYANAAFESRRGIAVGSLSHHPAGITHGPHPGAYEDAHGKTRTEELAVMLDCAAPLQRTAHAAACEDPTYHASFVAR